MTPTNPLITEARRLSEAASAITISSILMEARTDGHLNEVACLAFAANNILAFADKVEELQREIAELQKEAGRRFVEVSLRDSKIGVLSADIAALQSSLDDANGQLGEFFNTPSGAIIKALQAQVEELKTDNELLWASVPTEGEKKQNAKLREACEAVLRGHSKYRSTSIVSASAMEQLRAALEPK